MLLKCPLCGKMFEKKSSRQIYCGSQKEKDSCSAKVMRARNRKNKEEIIKPKRKKHISHDYKNPEMLTKVKLGGRKYGDDDSWLNPQG